MGKNESIKRLLNQLSQAIDQNLYYSVEELDRCLHNTIQIWKQDYIARKTNGKK